MDYVQLRPPILRMGGKSRHIKKLLAMMPKHHCYVEAFAGGAGFLLNKPRSPIEVYNDIDATIVEFFDMLQPPGEMFKELHERWRRTPCSRKKFNEFRDTWQDYESAERIYRWYVCHRQSFLGKGTHWGYNKTGVSPGWSRWKNAVDRLPAVAERLRDICIEEDTWENILPRFDGPKTFFYLDPPYVLEARKNGRFEHEMSDDDHRRLIDDIQELEGMVLLSGYPNPIYEKLPWDCWQFGVRCHLTVQRKGIQQEKRTECLWLNYPVPDVAEVERLGLVPYVKDEERCDG